MSALSEARRPGRPRSESARRAILSSVVELLAETGFAGLSMDAVAAKAGVGKATLYRWWPSKASLVAEAVHELAAEVVQEPDTGELAKDLEALLEGVVEAALSPLGKAAQALLSEAEHNSELAAALEKEFLQRRREIVSGVLARAAARGELRSGLDPELVADLGVAVVLHRSRLRPSGLDKPFVGELVDLIVEGMRPRS